MKRLLLSCLSFLLFVLPIHAQILRGLVVGEDGAPVPYARVWADQGSQRDLTDDSGIFELILSKGEHWIHIQHLGFQRDSFNIDMQAPMEEVFRLTNADLQMAEVEIIGGKRDPAYAIMKEVIANKKNFVRQFESYSCETYQKITLRRDSLPKGKAGRLYMDSLTQAGLLLPDSAKMTDLVESQSRTYFARPDRYKSEILAYRHLNPGRTRSQAIAFDGVGNRYETQLRNPYLFYLDISQADFNFYENLITAYDLGDRPFISPLNSTMWRLIYAYKLEKSYLEKGRVIHRIAVRPRNMDGPYFEGTIWIVDGIWAIQKLELDIIPSTLSYFRNFSLEHSYAQAEGGRWVLAEETYTYFIKDGKDLIEGVSLARHEDYKLDLDLPGNFFKNVLRSTEQEAFDRDSSYWETVRPMALEMKDISFQAEQDSLFQKYSSADYLAEIDSIYNHIGIMDILFNGVTWRDRSRGMRYYVDGIVEQMQWYGVGGYRHALGGYVSKTFKRRTSFGVGGSLDYGFANQDLRGEVRVNYNYNPRNFSRIRLRGGNIYEMINLNETIAAILSRGNFMNKVYVGGNYRRELINGLFISVGADFADRNPIDTLNLAEWTNELFGESNRPPSFEPFREFILDLHLTYTPGQKYYMEPYRKVIQGSKWPTFRLHYRKGIPGFFDSVIDYDFLSLEVVQRRQVGAMGRSIWRVKTGRFLQQRNLRFNDYTFFRGSDPYFFASPLVQFQLLGPTISTPNGYIRGHYLHDFQGALMDKIPLLKRTPLQATVGAGSLFVEDGNLWHSEIFGGIQWPFRVRMDRFKIGAFFVTSYSNNADAIQAQIKFGITWFNNARNTWSYDVPFIN